MTCLDCGAAVKRLISGRYVCTNPKCVHHNG